MNASGLYALDTIRKHREVNKEGALYYKRQF